MTPTFEYITQSVQKVLPQSRAAWVLGRTDCLDRDIEVAVMFGSGKSIGLASQTQKTEQLTHDWGRKVRLVEMRDAPFRLQYAAIQNKTRLFAKDIAEVEKYERLFIRESWDMDIRYERLGIAI
jgi:hypothetical protein